MKKIFAMLLALVMVLGLVACSEVQSGWGVIPELRDMSLEKLMDKAYNYGTHPEEGEIYLWATHLYAVDAQGDITLLDDRIIMVLDMMFSYKNVETGKLYENKILAINTSGKLCIYDGAEWVEISGRPEKENGPTVTVPTDPIPVVPTP